jgi:hypothetical protein
LHLGAIQVDESSTQNPYAPPQADLATSPPSAEVLTKTINPLSPAHIWKLWLAPRRFFSRRLRFDGDISTQFVFWIVGICSSIERTSTKLSQGNQPVVAWAPFWLLVGLGGWVGGLLIYFLGGWWYRLRLKWSGVPDPAGRDARELYIYTELIADLPAVLIVIVQTSLYNDYAAAWEATGFALDMTFIGLAAWGVIASYLGAVERFGLSGLAGAIWFFVLPFARAALAVALYFWAFRGGFQTLLEQIVERL